MRRTPTIWLTQGLIIIFGLLILSAFLINLLVLLTHLGEEFSIVRTLLVYSVMLGVVLLLATASWGLAKRRNYGRWFGVLSLLLFWGLLVLMKLRRPSGPYQYYEYDKSSSARWSRHCPGSSAWINLVLNTSLIILQNRKGVFPQGNKIKLNDSIEGQPNKAL